MPFSTGGKTFNFGSVGGKKSKAISYQAIPDEELDSLPTPKVKTHNVINAEDKNYFAPPKPYGLGEVKASDTSVKPYPTIPTPSPQAKRSPVGEFFYSLWHGGIAKAAEPYRNESENMYRALLMDDKLSPADRAKYQQKLADLRNDSPYESTTTAGKAGDIAGQLVGSAPQIIATGGVGGARAAGASLEENIMAKIAPKISPKAIEFTKGRVNDLVTGGAIGLTQSDKLSDVPKDVATGLVLGAILGAAGKGIGKVVGKVGDFADSPGFGAIGDEVAQAKLSEILTSPQPKQYKFRVEPRKVTSVNLPAVESPVIEQPLKPKSVAANIEWKNPQVAATSVELPSGLNEQEVIAALESGAIIPKQIDNGLSIEKVSEPKQTYSELGGLPGKNQDLGNNQRVRSFPITSINSEATTPEMKAAIAEGIKPDGAGAYERIILKQLDQKAKETVDRDLEGTISKLLNEKDINAEHIALGIRAIEKLQAEGNMNRALDVHNVLAEKLTTAGQTAAAARLMSALSPEGVVQFAVRTIKKAVTPEKQGKLDELTGQVVNDLNEVNKQAVDELTGEMQKDLDKIIDTEDIKPAENTPKTSKEELSDAEKLAKRIKTSLKDPKEKETTEQLINTLFKVAKEQLPKGELKSSNPLTFITEAIKDRAKYRQVWVEARKILTDKFADNPEKLAIIEDFLNKNIKRTFTQNQLNRTVSQGLKDLGTTIGEIVKHHYSMNSKVRTQLVQKLVSEAGLSGDEAKVLETFVRNRMKELTKVKKEQLLRQMFKEKILTPKKDVSEKIIEMSNLGAFQNDNVKSLVAKKLGLPEIDEVTARSLYQQAQQIQTMPDGRQKEVAIAKMLDTIIAKLPVSKGQKAGTIQTMAQLLNPKTFGRNIIGNTGSLGMQNVSDVVGAGIDKGLSLVTGKRSLVLPNLKTQAQGFVKHGKMGLEDALLGVDTSNGVKSQFDLRPNRTFRADGNIVNRVLNKLETATDVSLRTPDRAFYGATYEESLHNQMKAAGITEPTEKMIQTAEREAREATFQDDNAISRLFVGLKHLLNGGKEFGGGDFIIKYAKTPANLLARGLDYSPASVYKILKEASAPLFGREFDQRAFVKAFSKGIVGSTGLVGVGAVLHKVGIITGKPDKDQDVRDLNRQTGLGEYRVNVSALKRYVASGFNSEAAKLQKGDITVSYDWFQPQAINLALGADIDANGASAQGVAGTLINGLASGINTFADQPVMTGIQNLFSGRDDMTQGIIKVLTGVPASFVPTLFNQVKQLVDNQKRETYDPNWVNNSINLAKNKIPGAASTLPPKYDTLGKPAETYPNGSNNAFNVLLNPAFVSKYNPTPEQELVLDTYKNTGETGQVPRVTDRTVTVDKQKFILTPQEISELQRITGEKTKAGFTSINSASNDEHKIEAMKDVLTKARTQAILEVLKKRGVGIYEKGNGLHLTNKK